MSGQFSFTESDLSHSAASRQIRTTKRFRSAAKATEQGYVPVIAMQLKSAWPNAGKLFLLLCSESVEVPVTGTVIRIRNRETGLDLGVYRIVPASAGDGVWNHPITAWELCALSDHRAERNGNSRNGNAAQNGSQSRTEPVPAARPSIVPATAVRVSIRERVSHFTPPAPAPKPQPARKAVSK